MRRYLILAVVIAVLLLLLVVPGSAGFLVDLWFFREIGYEVIYTKEIADRKSVV